MRQAGRVGNESPPPLTFDAEVIALKRRLQPVRDHFQLAEECLQKLQECSEAICPGTWIPVGGFANGFLTPFTVLDAIFVADSVVDGSEAMSSFPGLLEKLQQCAEFQLDELAKTWLDAASELGDSGGQAMFARLSSEGLKLGYKSLLDVLIRVKQKKELDTWCMSTKLLFQYTQLNSAVHDLGVMVILWAKNAGVCGTSAGTFSTYTWLLLVIYFLQVHHIFSLATLPTTADDLLGPSCLNFGAEHPSQEEPPQYKGKIAKLPVLLHDFFDFYARGYQWGTEVISVRMGQRLTTLDEAYAQLPDKFSMHIHIEDPLFPNLNMEASFRKDLVRPLHSTLWRALKSIQSGLLPRELRGENIPSSPFPVAGEEPEAPKEEDLAKVPLPASFWASRWAF